MRPRDTAPAAPDPLVLGELLNRLLKPQLGVAEIFQLVQRNDVSMIVARGECIVYLECVLIDGVEE